MKKLILFMGIVVSFFSCQQDSGNQPSGRFEIDGESFVFKNLVVHNTPSSNNSWYYLTTDALSYSDSDSTFIGNGSLLAFQITKDFDSGGNFVFNSKSSTESVGAVYLVKSVQVTHANVIDCRASTPGKCQLFGTRDFTYAYASSTALGTIELTNKNTDNTSRIKVNITGVTKGKEVKVTSKIVGAFFGTFERLLQ